MSGRLLGPKELHPGHILDDPANRGMTQAERVADVPKRIPIVECVDYLIVADLLGRVEFHPHLIEVVLRIDEGLERLVRHALSVNPPFHLWQSGPLDGLDR
jgi:hypothetical protein